MILSTAVLLGLACLASEENTLRVVVKDSSGAPVAKAHVALLQHREAKPPKSGEPDPTTVDSMAETDAQGGAVLKAVKGRRYQVEVRAYGFMPWNLSGFRLKEPVLNVSLQLGFFVVH